MMIVVCYDVSFEAEGAQKRLRRISKICKDYGQRVQFSVFECIVDPAQWISLKRKLIREYDEENDSLRFYHLGKNYKNRIEHIGKIKSIEQEDPLIL